jgi:hypothetical protein
MIWSAILRGFAMWPARFWVASGRSRTTIPDLRVVPARPRPTSGIYWLWIVLNRWIGIFRPKSSKKKTEMCVFSSKFSQSFLDCPQIPFEMSRGMHKYAGKPLCCQYCHSCQSGDKCGAKRQNGERKTSFESSLSPGTGDRKKKCR